MADEIKNALRVANQRIAPREAELREYRPSLKEQISNALMGDTRPSPERRRASEGLADIAYYVPGVGEAIAGDKLGRGMAEGDYLSALKAALGVIPGSGKFAANRLPKAFGGDTYGAQMQAMGMKRGGKINTVIDTDPDWDMRINRYDGGETKLTGEEVRSLSTKEQLQNLYNKYFGPKQEWQNTKEQIEKSGMITPNPHGRPYEEMVNKALRFANLPATGQPFTHHRLNDLPIGKGTWSQSAGTVGRDDKNAYEYASPKSPVSKRDELADAARDYENQRMIQNTIRSDIQGASPKSMTTPTTERQGYGAPVDGITPAASTRYMEMPISSMAKLQSEKTLKPELEAQVRDTGITGKPFSPNDGQVVAADRIIPGAHTPSSAQPVWDQTHYSESKKNFPLTTGEMSSQGSTSMLGHMYKGPAADIRDPVEVKQENQAEIDNIMKDMGQSQSAPQARPSEAPEIPHAPEGTSGPELPPPPPEGGIGSDTSPDIQMPGMARGGALELAGKYAEGGNVDEAMSLARDITNRFGERIGRKSGGGAWTRKEGQSPSGGLNAKGRASLKAQGHDIKPPQPEGGPRKDSFCARSAGQAKMFPEAAKDPNSRLNKARRKWKCHADGGEVWDKPRPKGLGKPSKLSPSAKASAKAAAKASGRPWPNLVDNMRAARKDK
jgi:hypothetical protein